MNIAEMGMMREWNLIQSRLAAAKAKLASLETPDEKPPFWNRAYPINIELPMSSEGGPAVFGTTTIDLDTTFYVKGIEAFYTASGILAEDSTSPATITMPATIWPAQFDYTWSIRDSGTDRDWNNVPLPAMLMRSGNVHGLWWPGLQARLRGGTIVTITINPIFFGESEFSPLNDPIENHNLQVILTGVALRGDR